MFETSAEDMANAVAGGGSMCDPELHYDIDLIFSDANYRYVWMGGWYGPLYFEELIEEPEGGYSSGGGGGGALKNEDGSYEPARSFDQFFSMLA